MYLQLVGIINSYLTILCTEYFSRAMVLACSYFEIVPSDTSSKNNCSPVIWMEASYNPFP
jgi:hypothetical protein